VKLYDEGLPGRLGAHAYDFLVVMLGASMIAWQASWLSWACFVMACLGGLLLFNNRLLARRRSLPRRWRAPTTLVFVGGVILWPAVWLLYDNPEAGVRALVALAVFVATRFLYTPIAVPPRPRLGPSAIIQRD